MLSVHEQRFNHKIVKNLFNVAFFPLKKTVFLKKKKNNCFKSLFILLYTYCLMKNVGIYPIKIILFVKHILVQLNVNIKAKAIYKNAKIHKYF